MPFCSALKVGRTQDTAGLNEMFLSKYAQVALVADSKRQHQGQWPSSPLARC